MPLLRRKSRQSKPPSLPESAAAPYVLFRCKYPSLWNFWKHGVTSSFLTSFLTCREQTRLSYVEGWASRTTPLSMEFGTCCHWVLEETYRDIERFRSKMMPDTKVTFENIKRWVVERVIWYQNKWLSEVPKPTQKQLDQQERVYGLAEAVLPFYFDRWSGDFTGKYTHRNSTAAPKEWVSLEEVFEVPYIFADGRKTVLRGRRDGVFKDAKGRLWVFDTKCRSVINDEDTLETMPYDLQQMLYLSVTRKQTGKMSAGQVLNVIRRPTHRENHDTLPEFFARVADEVRKKYDHFFIRYELRIGAKELDEWETNTLAPLMDDVRAWWEGSAPHYMNPNSLITKYGRCQLFLPIVKQEFGMCYRREHAFGELAI